MSTEKDEHTAHLLISEYASADDMGRVRTAIAKALATSRREGRTAAWRDAIAEIQTVAKSASQGGPVALACVKIVERFEAATNDTDKTERMRDG